MSASAFDNARCDWVSRFETLVLFHTRPIVLVVVTELLKFTQFFTP